MIQSETLHGTFLINFIPCAIIIFILLFMVFNDAYEHQLVRSFLVPTLLLSCLIITDNFDYTMSNNGIDGLPHIFVSVIGHNLRMLIFISLIRISTKNVGNAVSKFMLYIPEIINFIVCLLAFNTKYVFWYDEGQIVKGFLAYVPHTVFVAYVFIMLIIAVRKLMIGKHNEGVYIAFALLLVTFAVAADILFSLPGVVLSAIALVIFCYYLYFHIEHYKFDTLTEARNRSDFEAAIKKPDRIYAILSIDMNGLKEINDTMGHYYGDLALITTSRAIQTSLPRKCDLYRIGGDEFVVLVNNELVNIEKLCIKIHSNTLEAGCTVAIGAAKTSDHMSFKDACDASDKAMYENKKKMKQEQKAFTYFAKSKKSKTA